MAEPDFLTVEEAARVLRISRTTAYKEAKRFLATGGQAGIPVCPVGGLLRVPRARLEVLAGGPVQLPPPSRPKPLTVLGSTKRRPKTSTARTTTRSATSGQLPFDTS